MTDDFIFANLDLADGSPENTARLNGWLDAIMRAFHRGRPTEEFRTRWFAAVRADGAVHRGVWDSSRLAPGSDVPVATFGHLVKTINAGAATIPAWMITDVTVAPTHRRRGLMRRLMTDNLDLAVTDGAPVAVLTASEGAIYQRFGFGPATRETRLRVDTSSRFRFRTRPDDGGRVTMLEPDVAGPFLSAVFARHHETTRGSLGRPNYYEAWLEGYDWNEDREDRNQRLAVRFGPDGEPDGFVAYAMKRHDDSGESEIEVEVRDFVTASPAAYLALWQFLADLDLAEVVTAPGPVVDPLARALVDARVRRSVSTSGSPVGARPRRPRRSRSEAVVRAGPPRRASCR
ncbi:MAG: GNAT family N-acetyltransferase [Knoellia sp.]